MVRLTSARTIGSNGSRPPSLTRCQPCNTSDATMMSMGTASQEWIEAHKRITGRECGECSACCKVLDVLELDKPAHQWCKHCRPGRGGCLIYDRRPTICRVFACAWLIDENVPER